MSGKYHGYPEYKESSVKWLGGIPTHWVETALKRYCKITDGSHHSPKVRSSGMPFVSVTDVGINDINFEDSKKIAQEDYLRLVQEGCKPNIGDVLLTKDGTIGRAAIVTKDFPDFVILSSLGLLTPTKKLSKIFLYYYLVSGVNIDQMNSLIHGSALRRMTISKIDNLLIIIPSVDEQEKIANFLDHETATIDTLIEKQQQLIKLLKEKRQAVISHAVTKGLNPNAPMRDSDVEWLGEVPEHWVVSALKYHVDTVNGFGFSSSDVCEEGVPFIRAGNIKKKSITPTDLYLPQSVVNKYKRVILDEGDIVISMVGSDPKILESAVGQIGVVPKIMAGAVPNQNVVILREKSGSILRRFLFYTLCSDPYRNHLNVFSHKLANQSIISSSLIVNAKFMLPNTDEQNAIIDFLDKRLVKIDGILDRNYKSLVLLQERRTALISAAVTGKIDVRNWVAPAHPCAHDISASLHVTTPESLNQQSDNKEVTT